MDPASVRAVLDDYDPRWADGFRAEVDSRLGKVTDGRAMLEEHGIDPASYEVAAKYANAIDAAAQGNAREAALASMAATGALVCAATGPGAPVCLAAGLFAAAAIPLLEALTDLFKQRTLPPSMVAAPVVTPGREPLSYSEKAAIVTATEHQRRNEQAVLAKLAAGYERAYRNVHGDAPDPDAILEAVSDALARAGYSWDPILPLPSYKQADDAAWAEAQRAHGYAEDWIRSSLAQTAAECRNPDRVMYCAPGNTLWRSIPIDTLDARPRLVAVADELRERAQELPRAMVTAAGQLAAQAAEDARQAWQEEHPGITPEQFNAMQLAAGDAAAVASAAAGEAAAGAYLDSYRETHGGMMPDEFEAAVAAGEVDRAAYEQADGSPVIEAGGGLDTSGQSSGAGPAWVGGLLLGGFAILFMVARKGRG